MFLTSVFRITGGFVCFIRVSAQNSYMLTANADFAYLPKGKVRWCFSRLSR